MDCACVYVDEHGDTPSFYNESLRTARKAHACGECKRVIAPGETYESTTGCWDGRIDRYKTCADCVSVRAAFFCERWNFGEIWWDLREHLNEVCWGGDAPSSDCITPLTKAARDKVCDLVEELWEHWCDDEEE